MSGLDSDTWALSEFDLVIVNGDAMTFSTDPGEKWQNQNGADSTRLDPA